jgi:hypothetical protein
MKPNQLALVFNKMVYANETSRQQMENSNNLYGVRSQSTSL